jgi:drug/metabolite transporter (DMT)-like permease
MTPIFAALIFKERVTGTVWLAVALSTLGLAFLSLQGLSVSTGVVLIFISAMGYALHIVGLGQWSNVENVFGLSIVQMVVICLVCTAFSAPNGIHPPQTSGGWAALLYMAVVSGSLTILGQTWAQAHISATRAAIIMTTEPVFAAFFAVLFGGETLTVRMLIGDAFVLAAMYIVELSPRREPDPPHLPL